MHQRLAERLLHGPGGGGAQKKCWTDRQTGQGERKPNGVGVGGGVGEGFPGLEMRPEVGRMGRQHSGVKRPR